MSARRPALAMICLFTMGAWPSPTEAGQTATPGYHPWAPKLNGPLVLDASELVAGSGRGVIRSTDVAPKGWVQRGNVMLPEGIAQGDLVVDPKVMFAVEDIPGNKYPRKHTLYLNFEGGMLFSGADNSAENSSALALQGMFPAYTGNTQKALSIVQAVENDMAPYGIRVRFLDTGRPSKTVPYTMEMIGGSWMDINTDAPASGVAPGSDCGALGQRHVVYTFANNAMPATEAANIASQEAAHAWGLDHTLNCSSVMSYCSLGDVGFSSSCDDLCEVQCQGPNSIGCQMTHEMFCGEGSNQQNEAEELLWLFGGNEPDMEPPTVEIVEPEDGIEVAEGSSVALRALVDDNYGGFGWKYIVTANGEEVYNEVDYDRNVDEMFRPAINLTKLTPGEWVVTVEAEDQFEHVTQDSITIHVDGVVVGPGDSTGSADGGANDEGGAEGCACHASASSRPRSVAALLGLVVVVGMRKWRKSADHDRDW